MDIDSYTLEGINFIEVAGEINSDNCSSLKKEITERLGASPRFVLNLRNVPYVDSTGIGTLMAMSDMVNRQGGRITLVGVSRNVRRILDLVNASVLFDTADGVDEAVRNYREDAPAAEVH